MTQAFANPPNFGVLHDFRQPLPHRQSYASYYSECLAEIEEADRLGFECAWFSEHHGMSDGFLPAPLVVAAAVATRTTRIRLGTCVLVLPLHHPLRVAEDAAVVDLISDGRLVLGVGQGYAKHEFAAFGVDRRRRARILEEAIPILRRAWTDGRTGFTGEEWQLPDGEFAPRPAHPIPILVGAVSEPAVERAVRLADGLIAYCGPRDDLLPRADLLARVLQRNERPRRSFRFVATGIVHVDDDADRAWSAAAPGIAYLEGELARHAHGPSRPPLRREDYLVGTPDEVAAGFINLHRAARFDHFASWTRLPGLSHTQALSSLRLLAQRVIPEVTRAGAT